MTGSRRDGGADSTLRSRSSTGHKHGCPSIGCMRRAEGTTIFWGRTTRYCALAGPAGVPACPWFSDICLGSSFRKLMAAPATRRGPGMPAAPPAGEGRGVDANAVLE